ncbi:MAG: outer membrane protein assembly factor BamA [Verrucomicrobiota bacterium]
MNRWIWVLLASFLIGLPAWAVDEEGPVVREIEIRFAGFETVNRAIVRANIQTTVGKPRSRDMIEQDVRSLIATGFFFDVRVLEEPVADGLKIIYQVTGKATIKEITVEGGKVIKNARLKREVKMKVGDVLDERKAHEDELKMLDIYEKGGFPDAKVEVVITIDKDSGKALLKYKVTEGDRVYIKKIIIEGNSAVKTAMLLKIIKTKARWWGSFLAGSGVLKDEQFQEDLDKLREYYRSKGYIDMEIKSWKTERVAPEWMEVRIVLFEGQQYKVGTVKIEGNKLFTTTELTKKLTLTADKVFTPDGFAKDIKALEDYYGSRGYLDTQVRSAKEPNIQTGRLDLGFTVKEGDLTYIEKVVIRGNTKTKDKVIRRELAVAPGDIYNTVRIDASKERLKNLGFFSKVEATPEPTLIPNRRDLAIQVEEQRTGNITFGAGFSSIDSLIGFVEVTQGNFDIFNWPNFTGAGQKLRVRAQLGLQKQDYTISFVEPWFLDQRLSLGVDIFHREASNQSNGKYTEKQTGGTVRLERALNEFLRASVGYTLNNIGINVDKNASQELQSQDGTNLRSSMELTLVRDSRNNVFLTTRGNQTTLSAQLAGGPLGGAVSDYKLNAKTVFFFPFFDKQVLQVLGACGVVQAFAQSGGKEEIVNEGPLPFANLVKVDNVPIYDRYFLGGANTLRGFSYQKVGPKDVNFEPIGGNTFFNATVEYTYPIVEKVRGAIFFDCGEVQKNSYAVNSADILADVGLGVRLNLPIGPLRLDYGYPIITDKHSGHVGKFQFSVGFQF